MGDAWLARLPINWVVADPRSALCSVYKTRRSSRGSTTTRSAIGGASTLACDFSCWRRPLYLWFFLGCAGVSLATCRVLRPALAVDIQLFVGHGINIIHCRGAEEQRINGEGVGWEPNSGRLGL